MNVSRTLKLNTIKGCWIIQFLLLLFCVLVSKAVGSENREIYEPIKYFEINPNILTKALSQFSIQTDSEILYSTDIVEQAFSYGVHGAYTHFQALEKILEGTGLKFERVDKTIFLIYKKFLKDNQSRHNYKKEKNNNIAQQELEEILVTATRRSRLLQNVALSISALDYKKIEKRRLVSMEDYLSTIPGINQVDRGVGRNSIIIRGIAADPAFEDATVGVYFDEVPLTGRAYFGSTDIKLVDMARVEILRGPQGTLYGAGSLAGTVRNIPVDPNLSKMEGKVVVGYSEMADEGSRGNKTTATVNIPIVFEKLAARVLAYRFENSGYIKNVAADFSVSKKIAEEFGASELAKNKHDIGRNIYRGTRVRVLWEPINELKVIINYLNQDLGQDGIPETRLALKDFTQARLQQSDAVDDGEELNDEVYLRNIVLNYSLDWADIVLSASSLSEHAQRNSELSWVLKYPASQFPYRYSKATIQELRIVSTLEHSLQFLAGVYIESNTRIDDVDLFYAGDPLLNPLGQLRKIYDFNVDTTIDQKALFGELSYDFGEKLAVTLGTRLFRYTKKVFTVEEGALVSIPLGSDKAPELNSSESGESLKLNFTYVPSDNSMAYVQYSEGFRLGGRQRTVSAILCDKNNDGKLDGTNVSLTAEGAESDKIRSYELGGKYLVLDNRLAINGVFYYNSWSGIPVSVQGSCGIAININAGNASTLGAEIESRFAIRHNINMELGASIIDAQLDKDVVALMAKAGDRLAGSAKYSLSIALQYDFLLLNHDAFLQVNYSRMGGFYGTLNEIGYELGKYHLINLKTGIKLNNISFDFYINNIGNADQLIWVDKYQFHGYPLKPRVAGLELQYHF